MVTATKPYQPQLLPFTDFASITPKTNLNDLNLNWKERDLPERIRTKHVHRLHPYLGKFVPQLVEIFLRKYQPQMVVDPFCGSGTTLVEATALGMDSFGSDISEFNCLLSTVKIARYEPNLLEKEVKDIVKRFSGEAQIRLLERRAIYTESVYLQAWYAPEALYELLAFRSLIPEYTYQDVLKVILSRAARSARLTTHYDLDFPQEPQTEPYPCYKHKRVCRPTRNAGQFLVRYSHDTVKRIKEFDSLRQPSRVEAVCGDSREVKFPDCDLVLTSPPYVGLIDYHQQHRYAYELLGLRQHLEDEIGSSAFGNSQKAQKAYVQQIEEVFANVKGSLTKGGHLVVVVHDRKTLYPEIAKHLGFKTETEIHRNVDRRTGRRANEFFESVFVWKT
jgi:DNA modification methylase